MLAFLHLQKRMLGKDTSNYDIDILHLEMEIRGNHFGLRILASTLPAVGNFSRCSSFVN